MAKIIIAGGQLMDAATLEDSSALAANYPLANLLTLQPGETTRFSDPSAAYVVVDLGSAKAVTFAAVIAHNGGAAGEWRVRGATSEANLTASPGFDSGSGGVSFWPASGKPDADVFHSFLSFASQTFRWWRLDIDDAANADGYFEAGRIMLASAWAPDTNFDFNAGIGWLDPSPIDEGVAGHMFPLARPKHRVQTLPFGFQTKADLYKARSGIYELQRLRGASKDVFVVQNPEEDDFLHCEMLHGLMRGTTSPFINDTFQRYSFSLRIEELIA
jgi:hypothetical protein